MCYGSINVLYPTCSLSMTSLYTRQGTVRPLLTSFGYIENTAVILIHLPLVVSCMSVSTPTTTDDGPSTINTSFQIDDDLSKTVDAVVKTNPDYQSRSDLFREAVRRHLGFE